jgi:hypothetical protein
MMKERPTECIFKVNHIFGNINLAPTCFGAAGAPSSGSPKDSDEIVRMLRHKCRISEGMEWITVCVLSAEGKCISLVFLSSSFENAWSKLQNNLFVVAVGVIMCKHHFVTYY